MSNTVVFSLDHLVGLGCHGGDTLGPHALQVRPHLVWMVLAEVIEQHRRLGSLGHRQPGGQDGAAEPLLETLAGGHRAPYHVMNSYLITRCVRAGRRSNMNYELIIHCHRLRAHLLRQQCRVCVTILTFRPHCLGPFH
jgi:hypothetical protein